jgi:DNA-binding transcriptional LysR family regulator
MFAPKTVFNPPRSPDAPQRAAKRVAGARASDLTASVELLAPEFTLRQLSYFVAAAHHGSVHGAAVSLHVSAPAVSAAIAHLESTLGVRLFHRRHARGLVLTDAGNSLAIECRNLLNQAWELGSGRMIDAREVQGWVHLGCLFSFAPFVIPPLVRRFQTQYPQARVYWHEGHHESLMEGLQTGAFELAILYDFEVPTGIECTAVRPAPLQAVLPGGHPLAAKRKVTVAELAAEPLVLLDFPRTAEYILSAFSAAGVAPRIAYRVHSIPMLRGLVASGLGCGLLNFCPPFTHAAMGSLVSRPLECGLRTPNIVVAHSHRYRFTRPARALVDCAEEIVRGLALSAGGRR